MACAWKLIRHPIFGALLAGAAAIVLVALSLVMNICWIIGADSITALAGFIAFNLGLLFHAQYRIIAVRANRSLQQEEAR